MPIAGRPGAPALRGYKTKPFKVKASPQHKSAVLPQIHRSSALASREGGIGRRPRGSGIDPTYSLIRSIEKHPPRRPSIDVYHAPIIGHSGILGGLEDLAQTFNPVALERSVAKTIRHPLASRSATGINAGMVVGGPGGFRIGRVKVPEEPAAELPKAGTPREAVRRSLGTARELSGKQKELYKEELAARVTRGQAASEAAGGGSAGHQAFMRELKGELPKVTFNNLQSGVISQGDLDTLARQLDFHPDLTPFEKVSVNEALRAAVDRGQAFRPFEIKLMQRAFGQEATKNLKHANSLGQIAVDVLNVPRSLMASFDVSAPFRQGLVAGAGHPKIFAKNFPGMFKSLVSEKHFQAGEKAIHERPNAPLYEVAGLSLPKLEGLTSKDREEQFSSQYAEKLPGVGRIVRGSGRAYEDFLNHTRADVFDSMIETARKKNVNVEDARFLRSLGNYVNAATGRGDLPGKALKSAAPAMNTIFFSPRLMYSRINFLDPTWYLRGPKHGGLDAFARRQALKSIVTLGAGTTLALALAGAYTRAKIGTDPRSADFAKLRLGNTRVDVMGGFQQYLRLAAQLEQGKIVSSTTGKTLNLGHGYGQLNRRDILLRFAEGKLAPVPSMVDDFFKGTTFAGAPISVKTEILSRVTPLVAQDVLDLQRSGHSIPLSALAYGVSAFGIGMQTYGSPKKKAKRFGGGGSRGSGNPLLGGGGGSNPLLPGGGGSSNPFLP